MQHAISNLMLDLAKHIVQQKSGHFDPSKFEDHYETALQDLLDKKQKGQPITKMAPQTSAKVVNLMERRPSRQFEEHERRSWFEKDESKGRRKAKGRLGTERK